MFFGLTILNFFVQRVFHPKVTTFKKQLPHDKSTRSVYSQKSKNGLKTSSSANSTLLIFFFYFFHDKLSTADEFGDANQPVDISDMTWEQRERVLRHLFAQINNLDKDKREHVMRIKNHQQTASTSKTLDSQTNLQSIGLGIVPQRTKSKETLPPLGKLSLEDNNNTTSNSDEQIKSTTFLTELQEP